ncbi:MAG: uracil phosphoribosyltransferase [Phycisphaera sp.]|nr:uracil phosphoribosyltransferase [Phycisphaera sp.]
MGTVHEMKHPLITTHLTMLRDQTTPSSMFRPLVRQLTYPLVTEATRDLRTEAITVTTPLTEVEGQRLSDRVAVVPILRAGLGMVEPVLEMLPEAEVWHLGLYRDESTLEPVSYYNKLPEKDPPDVAMVLDPMLATGGSATAAIGELKAWGVQRIKLLCILAAPPGVEAVVNEHGDVDLFVCAIDKHLNQHGYIVPGLGDAGDRIFNTRAL